MAKDYRELNRATFQEIAVQRYLLESYYLNDLKSRRLLLPKRLRDKKLNIIVPERGGEDARKAGCRLDLDLSFRGLPKPVPNEVKWNARNLKKSPSQVKELIRRRGFCSAIFLPPEQDRIRGIEYVQIPFRAFKRWFLERAPILIEETASEQAGKATFESSQSFWLIPIRSEEAVANFEKMKAVARRDSFWAFQNDPYPMRRVLSMKKGDRCLFLRVMGSPGQFRLPSATTKYRITSWYEGAITRPYHMRLEGKTAHIFETSKKPIAERSWPHFISMKLDQMQERCNFRLSLEKFLGLPFTEAINRHSSPFSVTQDDYERILQKLRHQIEK